MMKKGTREYEAPKAVRMRDMGSGTGQCNAPGSSASNCNSNGNSATSKCNNDGSSVL
jgi:hypothetical protein